MIKKEEVYKIGIFNKPHGVKGELLFTFTDDIFDRTDECDYLICTIDGIFVPFFIKEYRFKSDTTALIILDGVDSVEKARMFTNVDVYFPTKYVETDEEAQLSLSYFIGFEVHDKNQGKIGTITEIDDSTPNLLFVVTDGGTGHEYDIPAHEELMTDIDHKNKIVTFDLPEGLLTMNHNE